MGIVRAVRRGARGVTITIESTLGQLAVGDSVSVDGACLTVSAAGGGRFSCAVVAETLRATGLGALRPGARVNLERAVPSGAPLGGHIVNGHVDCLGTVTRVTKRPLALEIAIDPRLARYVAPKGSIAVSGVSLTVGPAVRGGHFQVFVIPHTWERTNLSGLRAGSRVNVEVDIVAKYVERILDARKEREEA